METFDADGKPLDALIFIGAYRSARKLAGARFIKVRMTKATQEELVKVSAQPEVIQLGKTPAPGGLGKTIMRVASVPVLGSGIQDGFEIVLDEKAVGIRFEVKTVPQVEIVNLG